MNTEYISQMLPGLARLLDTGRRHGLNLKDWPAGRAPPRAGELLCGMPVDPMLATAWTLVGKLTIGKFDSLLVRCDDEVNCFLSENEEWQSFFPSEFWPDHFRSLMLFGREMLYGYATIPCLANSEGLQPVVHVDPYEQIYALPIASDVNRFFEGYTRYLEMAGGDPEYGENLFENVIFPWNVPEIIALDRPLVEMIKKGCFDPWMYERNKQGRRFTEDVESTRAWISKVLRFADGGGTGS
ncbi:MAG TPA: hypothetical protein VK539_29665 [Myxococcaceae bacterium]|nr:hypothetical protein [Myxococcaceae bacterium]